MGALTGIAMGGVACIFIHRELQPIKDGTEMLETGTKELATKLDKLATDLDRLLVGHDKEP